MVPFQVTFDAHDPAALARFWALALDYVEQPPPAGHDSWESFADAVGIPADQRDTMAAVVDPAGVGPRLLFQRVPEGKTAKNRVHLDVDAGAGGGGWEAVQAHVQRLLDAGATLVEERSMHADRWVVLTDPEGNELCVQ